MVLAAAVLLSSGASETGILAESCQANSPPVALSSSISIMCCRPKAWRVVKCSIHRLKKQPKSGEGEETGSFRAANVMFVFLRKLHVQEGAQKQTANPPKNRRQVMCSLKREKEKEREEERSRDQEIKREVKRSKDHEIKRSRDQEIKNERERERERESLVAATPTSVIVTMPKKN